jgi:FkbM family methyltransferase
MTEFNFNYMRFLDENNKLIRNDLVEVTEQNQAKTFITNDSVVLELGARYGTVSCIISKILSNPFNLVAVEPDERVWNALEMNMTNNFCHFNIIKGAISNKPLSLTNYIPENGYAIRTKEDISGNVKCYTINEIESMFNIKFNTLVADCEGFLETFFEENPQMYEQLNLVMFEKDCPKICNYDKIIGNLKYYKFKNLISGSHEVWRK